MTTKIPETAATTRKKEAVCCDWSESPPLSPADAVSTTPPDPVPVGPPGLAVPTVPVPVKSAQVVTRGVKLSKLEVALRYSLAMMPKFPVYWPVQVEAHEVKLDLTLLQAPRQQYPEVLLWKTVRSMRAQAVVAGRVGGK